MRHFVDSAKIRRYQTFGKVATFLGLGLMIVGIFLAFTRQEAFAPILGTSFTGLLLSQVAMTIRNRWGRHPRMDEVLDAALKGMDDRYSVFHYLLGASHALFAPTGVYVLCTADLDGTIEFADGKWIRRPPERPGKKPPRPQALADPTRPTQSENRLLRRALEHRLKENADIPISPILVFVHPNAQIEAERAEVPGIHVKKLKAYLRSRPKGRPLAPEALEELARSTGLAGVQS